MKRLMLLAVAAFCVAIPSTAGADNGIGSSCQNPYTVRYTSGGGIVGDIGQIGITVSPSGSGQLVHVEPVNGGSVWLCEAHGTDSDSTSWSKAFQNGVDHTTSGSATAQTVVATARNIAGSTPGSSCGNSWTIGYNAGNGNSVVGDTTKILVSPGSGPYTSVSWTPASGVIICSASGNDSDISSWSSHNTAGDSHTAAGGQSIHDFGVNAEDTPVPRSDLTPPAVPSGLVGTAGNGQASLSWNANGEADFNHYNLYRGGSKIAGPLVSPSYTDTGLANGTAYSYTVTAVDNVGNESAQSAAAQVTPQASLPTCPTGQVGTPPNCHVPTCQELGNCPPPCPQGQVGTPPNCHKPVVCYTKRYLHMVRYRYRYRDRHHKWHVVWRWKPHLHRQVYHDRHGHRHIRWVRHYLTKKVCQ